MTSSVYSNLVSCWILLRIIRKGYFVLNILSHSSEVDQLQQVYSIIISFLEAIKLSLHPTSSKARRNHTLVISNVSIITSQSYIAKITFRLKLLFGLCLILTKWSCYWPICFQSFLRLDIVLPFRVYPTGRSLYIIFLKNEIQVPVSYFV